MNAVFTLVPALWVGSLWTIGYLVAPALFATLDDRALAGDLAGRLFSLEAWLSLGCGGLLVASTLAAGSEAPWRRRYQGLVVSMLVLVGMSEWVFGARIEALRAAGGVESTAFAAWHGAASVSYLAASVLGLYLLLTGRRPPGG